MIPVPMTEVNAVGFVSANFFYLAERVSLSAHVEVITGVFFNKSAPLALAYVPNDPKGF